MKSTADLVGPAREASIVPPGRSARIPVWLSEFGTLAKVRLNALVLVTALVGFLLASPPEIAWLVLFYAMLGTGLVAAGSSVLNQVLEIHQDAGMSRTQNRPLAAGRLSRRSGIAMGICLCVAGLVPLALMVNLLSALVALVTLVTYVAVYTPMKRHSALCTVVGAVAGGLPPVIGWTAAGGSLGAEAAFLFALLFFWQMPHFLAINWLYREEYERVGFVMWSNGDRSGVRTSRLVLFFTGLLFLVTVVMLPPAFFSWPAMAGSAVLGATLLALGVRFAILRTRSAARHLFFSTLLYLPLVLSALVFGI